MSGFDREAIKVESGDGRNIRVMESFMFTRKDGATIVVPEGSSADGASTPRILWRVLPPFGNYWMSAVLHDYLYRHTGFPKDFCDETFLEAMLDEKINPLVARTIYLGVKWFGGLAFKGARTHD